ncbi:MAG: hypothetical protein L0Y71_23025 [Gemmataceae bacterium]|nr:hypothetical protein [Gemmataceae bacterium]
MNVIQHKPAPAPASPADNPWKQRILLGVVVVLLPTSLYFIYRHFQGPSATLETMPNRPLLKREGKDFHDKHTRVRFTPPPRWSMQLRSTEAPNDHRGDRMIVKFKRILPNQPTASFRVHVVDTPRDQDIADCVKNRSPGHDWKRPSAVSPLTVCGLPAAKITYSAMYNSVPSLRDIIGVRRGDQVFYFVASYQIGDRAAQEECRQAISTVLLEQS